MIALTHSPSPLLAACERTFVPQADIDLSQARRQHAAYCDLLRQCGADVVVLDVNSQMPDSVFIEDTAMVLDEVAILASMGASSRRAEPAGIESYLRQHRPTERIELPATIDGGDVLRVGRRLLVGQSCRTNAAGAAALAAIAGRFGYEVLPVPVKGCLHLKTACTALPDGRLLTNACWLDMKALGGFELVNVPEREPWAANVALIDSLVLTAAAHEETSALIRQCGFAVRSVDVSEFAKAEGGVTCLSLLIP